MLAMTRYAELEVTTNFTFLTGGSHPEELVATAKALGLEAIAVTDRNTLAGAVRAHIAAKEAGIKFIVGTRLDLQDAPNLLAYPTGRAAYGRLCRLLTLGQRRAGKGQCTLFLDDVAAHAEGLIFIVLPPDDFLAHSPMSSPGLTGRSSNHASLGNEAGCRARTSCGRCWVGRSSRWRGWAPAFAWRSGSATSHWCTTATSHPPRTPKRCSPWCCGARPDRRVARVVSPA